MVHLDDYENGKSNFAALQHDNGKTWG